MLVTVTMQSHCVWTSHKLLTKIKSLHVLIESLLEGIKQHSLRVFFHILSSRSEQSFSLQQLLMTARNNYGTRHRNSSGSLPVFSVFLLLHTQLTERITWVARHNAHKKVNEKWMGREDLTEG